MGASSGPRDPGDKLTYFADYSCGCTTLEVSYSAVPRTCPVHAGVLMAWPAATYAAADAVLGLKPDGWSFDDEAV